MGGCVGLMPVRLIWYCRNFALWLKNKINSLVEAVVYVWGLRELIGKIIFMAYFFTLKEKDTAKSCVFVGGLRNGAFFLYPLSCLYTILDIYMTVQSNMKQQVMCYNVVILIQYIVPSHVFWILILSYDLLILFFWILILIVLIYWF